MPDENQYPAIIISGMHRSGTSLTASLMAALSVHLGDHLLPADSNNRRGYFEDLKFLRFHQRVLSQLCPSDEPGHADWGWTESENLDISRFREFRDQAQRLLMAGDRKAGPWGWKDPRTTLFLDFWDSLLDQARYVLVYRFPWDVADSMQRVGADVFLGNPEYAYRIWAFYNRRLRDFYVQNADRCVLVSTNALQGNLEKFVSLTGDRLSLPEPESRLEEVFESGLFGNISGQDPLIDLVAAAYPDCTRLLSELDELADISGAGLWQARPVRSRLSRPDATDEGPIDVSVVTPCYEQGTLLLEAIASVERHAPARCELIIVNDGSRQPKTIEILDLLKRCGYFVVDQENAGLSAVRNRAIGLARGRYILPLDDDNRIREGFLAEAISVLDGSPEIGIVYGERNVFGLEARIDQMTAFDLDTLLEDNYIDACAVLRKQVWIDCQGYDPLMCPADDWELWIHAAALGWRFHHIPHVTFDYRVRPGSLISPFRSAEKQEGYRKRIRVKHSELYRAKSVKELEAVKRLLADQTDQQNRLKNERDLVVSELEVARAQIAARDQEIGERNKESQVVRSEVALKEQKLQTLSVQVAERDARIKRITSSLGWRLLSHYGRIKYRYLLPVYRLFGQIPADQTETKHQVGLAPHTVEQIKDQSLERDITIQPLVSDAAANQEHRKVLMEQIADRDAELARIKASAGWRLLQAYGRIKYRHLLPIYRLLGLAPQPATLSKASMKQDSAQARSNPKPSRRSLPTVEVHIPISPNETFLNMAHYLTRSLRVRGGRCSNAPIVLTIGAEKRDPDLASKHPWMKDNGVEVRWIDETLFAREGWFGTATERFRHEFTSDVVLTLDADTLIVGPLDDLVEEVDRTGALCGVIAHIPPFSTREQWQTLYSYCGLGALVTPCEHSGWGYMFQDESLRFCPPYFNLGVLAAPAAIIRSIGSGIYDLMAAVDEVQRTNYRVQIAVSLAVTKLGLPFRTLPFRWNFANDPLLEALHADELRDVRIIHLLRKHQLHKNDLYASLENVEAMLSRTDLRVINAMAQRLLAEIHPQVKAEDEGRLYR